MPAASAAPGRLPVPGAEHPWLAEDGWLAGDEGLAGDAGLAPDAQPTVPWREEDPGPGDPGRVPAWLERELARDAPWLEDDPEWAEAGPAVREVLKAGWWDRSCGDGAGFAAGGVADRLAPGPVLAGLAGDRWAAGLGRLSDDELVGVLRAARRLASWAASMELAAAGDLWARRTAEEDAGDTGAAVHADDEIAAALTLTRHAANHLLDLAVALGRLPLTAAALAGGDIDLPRARVIADEVTGLAGGHAAAVERAVIGAAPGQTTGQLRAAVSRAVRAADPTAASRRKEQALREARVERWAEPAGTAALAGRDLPAAQVLAADANLTAAATQLKAAGAPGTMDTLRAQIYLALLTGVPVASLLPGPAGATSGATSGAGGRDQAGRTGRTATAGGSPKDASPPGSPVPPSPPPGSPPPGARPDAAPRGAVPSLVGLAGSVNLTVPLATWLGMAGTPGHAAGFGPLDATDARALTGALAAQDGTRWCLTITGPGGRPVAHGCARARPSPGPSRWAAATAKDKPTDRSRGRRAAGAQDGPTAASRAGPGNRSPGRTWTFTLTWLDGAPPSGPGVGSVPPSNGGLGGAPPGSRGFGGTPPGGGCGHAWETPAYQPSPGLRHLLQIRHATCAFPGCRRPAAQCDADHTLPYDRGGRTCLCNLAPLCRHHHRCKQAEGWHLGQREPGTMTWTTPSGRKYVTTATQYPM